MKQKVQLETESIYIRMNTFTLYIEVDRAVNQNYALDIDHIKFDFKNFENAT